MQFDRNNLIGLVLLGALMIAYLSITNRNRQALLEAEQAAADSIALVEAAQEAQRAEALRQEQEALAELLGDSSNQDLGSDSLLQNYRQTVANERRSRLYGDFASQASGTEMVHVLEDEHLRLEISNHGGHLKKVQLKQHKDLYGNMVELLNEENSQMHWEFFYEGNRRLRTDSLYSEIIPSEDGRSVTFRLQAGEDRWMDQVYRLTDTAYFVDYDLVFHRFDEVIPSGLPTMTFNWDLDLRRQERNQKYETQMSKAYYRNSSGSTDYKTRNGEVDLDNQIEWLAYVDQFFHAALISSGTPFERNGELSVEKLDDDTVHLKSFSSTLFAEAPRTANEVRNMHFSFAPNDFQALKKLDNELQAVVPVGGFGIGWVNKVLIIPVFQWLNRSIANYGLIILILTLMIKLVLSPLTYRSYVSMAKMKLLQPELNALKEKYGDDQQRMGQEQMKLYSQTGVSPLGGCLPMVLQMPILFAMYRFFPNSIELRQESFLWATDLSSYDVLFRIPELPFIGDHISGFTLLAGISSLLYARMNASMTPQTGGPAQYIQYFFPIMMIFIFNNFSSALTYYYLLQNLISFGQQWVLKTFFIDNDKLHAQIQDKKKNPQKKSAWAKRMEAYTKTLQDNQEAMKRERRQQQQARRNKKNK